jgi:autotransporter-associated beta strand protein
MNVVSGTLIYGGIIANNTGGTGSLIKTGGGILSLTGNSTYGGDTIVTNGILSLGKANALPSSSTIAVASGATLRVGVNDATGSAATGPINISGTYTKSTGNYYDTLNRPINLSSGTISSPDIANTAPFILYGTTVSTVADSGTSTISIPLGAALKLRLKSSTYPSFNIGTNSSLEVQAVLADYDAAGDPLIKNGAGTMILYQANTYSGATIVSNGTLVVNNTNGFGTGYGALTVMSNATLRGTGTISNVVTTIQYAGTLAGGPIGTNTGTLTISNSPVLQGIVLAKLNKRLAQTADKIIVTNFPLAYAGVLVVTNVGDISPTLNDTFTLFDATSYSGAFTNFTLPPLAPGLGWNISGLTVDGSIRVDLMPPGTIAVDSTNWNAGGLYVWKINQATSGQGTDPGWDFVNVSGVLTVSATAASPYIIQLNSFKLDHTAGLVADFNPSQSYSWTIATAAGGITGFDAGKFTIDTSGFSNFTGGGVFRLEQSGNSINLLFGPHAGAPSDTTLGYEVVGGNMNLYFTNLFGLSAVEGITTNNCTMTGVAYVAGYGATNIGRINRNEILSLPLGTTNLIITAVQVDHSKSATVNARVYDRSGNARQFDPVVAQLVIPSGGEIRQIYSGLLSAERYVLLINGNPGMASAKLIVNGRGFEIGVLSKGQKVFLDVGEAMIEGENNTIVFIGRGEPGAWADLVISDRLTGTTLPLISTVEPPVMTVLRNGEQVEISWLGPANFFILESSDSLGANWEEVTAEQTELEGFTTVKTEAKGAIRIFRLRQ